MPMDGDLKDDGKVSLRDSQHPTFADHLLIPAIALLGRSLLGLKVHMDQTEALLVTARPFEVIEQTPLEVAFQWVAFRDGAARLAQVGAEVEHAVEIEDLSGAGDVVVRRTAVFGNDQWQVLLSDRFSYEAHRPVHRLR